MSQKSFDERNIKSDNLDWSKKLIKEKKSQNNMN